jgi:serine/threonine-protein kinase
VPGVFGEPVRTRGRSDDWSTARTRADATASQRDWSRHGPRIAVAATAAVAVIALVGWMTRSSDDQPDSPGSSVDQSAGRSAAVEQLTKVMPTGYPAGRCEVVAAQSGAVTEMDCGRNSEVGGPVAATYTLYEDRGALRAAFQALVEKSRAVTCPGRIQSPGAWHRASTPPGKSDGMLLCGFRQSLLRIVWTSEADLLLSDVQADERADSFQPLFAWWGMHS